MRTVRLTAHGMTACPRRANFAVLPVRTQAVVFVLGPGSRVRHVEKLVGAFGDICARHARANGSASTGALPKAGKLAVAAAALPEVAMLPREAFFAPTER